MSTGLLGIDVSNNQGTVDWSQVAGHGVKFAWCKVSEGTWFSDDDWARNRDGARAHGIHVGGYHYARPDKARAVDEADYFCHLLGKPQPGDLLPVLDFEVSSGLSKTSMSRWANAFMDRVKANTGVECPVYTYPYFLSGKMSNVAHRGRKLWYADYTGVGGRYRWLRFTTGLKVVAQQYSSTARVPGVHGNCDVDWARSLAPITVPAPPKPVKKDNRWTWARWHLGEGEYAKYGPRKGPHPGFWPGPHDWAWLVAFVARRKVAK